MLIKCTSDASEAKIRWQLLIHPLSEKDSFVRFILGNRENNWAGCLVYKKAGKIGQDCLVSGAHCQEEAISAHYPNPYSKHPTYPLHLSVMVQGFSFSVRWETAWYLLDLQILYANSENHRETNNVFPGLFTPGDS